MERSKILKRIHEMLEILEDKDLYKIYRLVKRFHR